MLFPYFVHYEQFAAFLEGETTCDCCRQTKHCLDAASFYGEETIKAICPDCLAGGELKGRDIYTCEGDITELIRQIQVLHPGWPVTQVEKLAAEKTEELEKTTPPIISWQDWPWPCADGDYCTFIGYGSKALYNRLAKDQDGAWLFQLSLYHLVKEDADADKLWEESMPDREIRDHAASQEHGTIFYVFESRPTSQIVTVWDMA